MFLRGASRSCSGEFVLATLPQRKGKIPQTRVTFTPPFQPLVRNENAIIFLKRVLLFYSTGRLHTLLLTDCVNACVFFVPHRALEVLGYTTFRLLDPKSLECHYYFLRNYLLLYLGHGFVHLFAFSVRDQVDFRVRYRVSSSRG